MFSTIIIYKVSIYRNPGISLINFLSVIIIDCFLI
nr:hypothetical protein ELOWGMBK_ELOWGMBK_CDS_0031 [Herelleviridae sp.]CAI9752035.1 hypothetical protein QGKEIAJE_QGKEIAJE_CDS_0030 [uncultured phage]